jgi:hypothetical protein
MKKRLGQILVVAAIVVLLGYSLVAFLMLPYYNWQYAKEHGFVAWFLFGEVVATGKAIAWPYFVVLADRQPSDRIATTGPANSGPRSFKCTEPLPEFTLGPASNPSDAEVATLCACIWSKLPEGGWERRVSAQMRSGVDPGWRGRGFAPRFSTALKACGGYSL